MVLILRSRFQVTTHSMFRLRKLLQSSWPQLVWMWQSTRLNGAHGYQMYTRAEIISQQSLDLISVLRYHQHGTRDTIQNPATTLQTSAIQNMMNCTVRHLLQLDVYKRQVLLLVWYIRCDRNATHVWQLSNTCVRIMQACLLYTSAAPEPFLSILRREKIYFPLYCGGRGTCGKCRIRITEGSLPITCLLYTSQVSRYCLFWLAVC